MEVVVVVVVVVVLIIMIMMKRPLLVATCPGGEQGDRPQEGDELKRCDAGRRCRRRYGDLFVHLARYSHHIDQVGA